MYDYDKETLLPGDLRQEAVQSVLKRQTPRRFVFAPNFWQWFAHQRNHHRLPPEIRHCRTQLDLINYLGLDVFSRNTYCDEQTGWFGGLAEEVWSGVEARKEQQFEGRDRIITKTYHTRKGTLTEQLRYVSKESTLVQEIFALTEPERQLEAVAELIQARRWKFRNDLYLKARNEVVRGGVVIAGELFSPLKLLHLLAGPVTTTYLLEDHADRIAPILAAHEAAQLDLVKQMTNAGVPVMMAMDNLDSAFQTPAYVERYSASFYEKTSRICHEHGSLFFIHACGRQKANLKFIDSLGVDGLEGVAFPPLGDVTLEDAFAMTSNRFIITGGVSAFQTRDLQSREDVFDYVRKLFKNLKRYAHRFMFSASCNTAIDTSFSTIRAFADAWYEYREL